MNENEINLSLNYQFPEKQNVRDFSFYLCEILRIEEGNGIKMQLVKNLNGVYFCDWKHCFAYD